MCLGNQHIYVLCLQFVYFRSISGEEAAGDSDDDEKDSDTEEQEAPTDYVKGERPDISQHQVAEKLKLPNDQGEEAPILIVDFHHFISK